MHPALRWLLAFLAWSGTTAVLAPVCFFGVIFLAGPHGGALPLALHPFVALAAVAILLAVPLLAARAAWRRLRAR